MSNAINKEEIDLLFKKFSHPMMKSAIISHQSQMALGISKILWLAFVSNNDSEKRYIIS